jgi:DNA-binding transcriptional MerR regulator
MRISQLSQRAGLPVGTVKFYLRTGLLHPGRATSATQAVYDDSHVARLRLVRALLEVGSLSHAEIQRVLEALEEPAHDALDTTTRLAVAAAAPSQCGGTDLGAARDIIEDLGWTVDAHSPHLRDLADALHALDAVGASPSPERMRVYADAAAELATDDVRAVAETDEQRRAVVAAAGAVLYDSLLRALRRLATESQVVQARNGRVPAPRQGDREIAVSSAR